MVAQYFIFGSTLYVIVFFFLIEVFQFNSSVIHWTFKKCLDVKKKKKKCMCIDDHRFVVEILGYSFG